MGQILQRDTPQVNVEICELEQAGLVLRICPLEATIPISNGDIEIFINCLEQQLVSAWYRHAQHKFFRASAFILLPK